MIRRLSYLSGLAILGVVLFHAAGMGFVAMFAWAPRHEPAGGSQPVGGIPYYLLRVLEQSTVVAVPAFLCVSGFFIAMASGRERHTMAWQAVANRIRYLLIPYLLWSLAASALRMFEGRRYSLSDILVDLAVGRANPVYYFIPLVIQLYLLAPLMAPLARARWKLFLAVTGAITLAVQLSFYPTFWGGRPLPLAMPSYLFPAKIFWMALGMVLGFHAGEFRDFLVRRRAWLLATALVCIPLGVAEWEMYVRAAVPSWLAHTETLIDSLYSLALLLAYLGYSGIALPAESALNFLGSNAFGIYLTHALAIEYGARLLYRYRPALLGEPFLLQPLFVALGLGVPLALMGLVRLARLHAWRAYIFG